MQSRAKRWRVIFLFFCLIFLSHHIGFTQNGNDLQSEIYSKLRDRRCTTATLDKCNCPDAREMKAYIGALIDAGVSKDEIFYRVAKKFTLHAILDEQIKQGIEKRLIKEAGDRRPQIFLGEASFNFGRASKKQGRLRKNIKIFNKGNLNLTIKNIKVSCSCVTAALTVGKDKSPYFGASGAPDDWQMVIAPGGRGELEIIFDLGHSSITNGKLVRHIFISSGDPLYPEALIKIEAEVSD